jgi:thioredoxin
MQEIKSLSQFNQLKATPLVIIDFWATWCGPCKAISPAFEKLATPHESSTFIVFGKVDVDKAKDVAQACGITAMPTFQFLKDGKKVDEVKGADVQQLTTKIGYYTSAAMKENAQGPKVNVSKSVATPGSLRSLIDIEASKILNGSIISSVRNIASPPPAGYAVASASGARLLIHLSFTQPVTPSHIKASIAKDSFSNGPSRIQVGTNVPVHTSTDKDGVVSNDLRMESLAKAENSQSFNIFSDEYINGMTELKLKASKFTAIKSLTIRIDANLSGEDTKISKIGEMDIIGISV